MGNFTVDLSGAWRTDQVSEVAMEHSMGDLRLAVPTSVRLADDSHASARFADPVQIDHDGETSDPAAPVVRLDLSTTMGGTRIRRIAERGRALDSPTPSPGIQAPAH